MATKFGFANRENFAMYLELRMEEHRRWQHDLEAQSTHEIIDEVQTLPKRRPRSGDLFAIAPDVVQRDLVVRQ